MVSTHALLTVLGNAGGALTQVALLAAGLGPLVQRSIVVCTVVKLVGAAKPKVFDFFAAVLAPFDDPSGGPVPLQMAMLGLVFVLIALVSDGAWGLMAGTARGWLGRSPHRLSNLTGAGGLVMVGLGVRLALSGRTD